MRKKSFLTGKSLVLVALFVIINLGGNVLAQIPIPEPQWKKVSSPIMENPITGDYTIAQQICVDSLGNIYLFSEAQCAISLDQGITWNVYAIPYFSGQSILSSKIFKGRIYLATGNGIYSSLVAPYGNLNWTMSSPGAAWTLSSNANTLFAFGFSIRIKTTDGLNWSNISNFPLATNTNVSVVSDNVVTVFDYIGNGILPITNVIQSYDNGNSWDTVGTMDIIACDADVANGQYNVVGINESDKLISIGQYDFRYPSGILIAVHYFAGHYWMGGFTFWQPTNFVSGILMADGALGSLTFVDGTVLKISSNKTNLAVAITNNGGVYILKHGPPLITTIATTAKENLIEEELTFYPNPSKSLVKVKVVEKTLVKLCNSLGQVLFSKVLSPGEETIDISSFPSGIYSLNGEKLIITH
jgi:hypothetical protein